MPAALSDVVEFSILVDVSGSADEFDKRSSRSKSFEDVFPRTFLALVGFFFCGEVCDDEGGEYE